MEIKNHLKGFTLVELIVVIAILGILAVAGLAVLNPLEQFKKANDSRRISDLSQIQRALETYYQDNGKYPPIVTLEDYRITALNGSAVDWGKSWSPYMNLIPKDPSSTKKYIYYSPSGGQSYFLYANLERGSYDPQACQNMNLNEKKHYECKSIINNGIASDLCGGPCNFGVSSPNFSP